MTNPRQRRRQHGSGMLRLQACLPVLLLVCVLTLSGVSTVWAAPQGTGRVVSRRHRGSLDKVRGQFGPSTKMQRRHASTTKLAPANAGGAARRKLKSYSSGKGKGGSYQPASGSADYTHSHSQGSNNYNDNTNYNYNYDYNTGGSSNIFEHSGETMEVECGSAESPFLTTFVTSIAFRDEPLPTPAPGTAASRSRRSTKKSAKSYTNKSNKSSSSGKGKGKGGGGMMMSGSKYSGSRATAPGGGTISSASGDGFYQVTNDDVAVPPIVGGGANGNAVYNELTETEARIMSELFRDVYNHLTFQHCDGFFRTIYTASMTLAAEKEDLATDGSYSVTLEKTYEEDDPYGNSYTDAPTDQPDAIPAFANRPLTPDGFNNRRARKRQRTRRRLSEEIDFDADEEHHQGLEDHDGAEENEDEAADDADLDMIVRHLSEGDDNQTDSNHTYYPAPAKEAGNNGRQSSSGSTWSDSTWMSPENYPNNDDAWQQQSGTTDEGSSQTVEGSDLVTIYYVSLTATCRNCEVTPEVNFPLLRVPEDELDAAEPSAPLTVTNSSAPEEDVCTCPAGADESQAYARRRRTEQKGRDRKRRRLEDYWYSSNGNTDTTYQQQQDSTYQSENSLYVPPPRGPTADEYLSAMNAAIAQNAVLQRRVLGLAQLVEPDYFEGENPPRVDPNSPAPTVSWGSGSYTPYPTTSYGSYTPFPSPAPVGDRDFLEPDSLAFRGPSFCLALALTALTWLWVAVPL